MTIKLKVEVNGKSGNPSGHSSRQDARKNYPTQVEDFYCTYCFPQIEQEILKNTEYRDLKK